MLENTPAPVYPSYKGSSSFSISDSYLGGGVLEEFLFFSFTMKWTITESKIILMKSQQINVIQKYTVVQPLFPSNHPRLEVDAKTTKMPIISRMHRVRRDVAMATRFF